MSVAKRAKEMPVTVTYLAMEKRVIPWMDQRLKKELKG